MSSGTCEIVEMGKTTAKGGINLFFGMVLSTVISTVGTVIVARLLTPADYGLFAKAMLPPLLTGLFWRWGIAYALVKFLAQYNVEKKITKLKQIVLSGIFLNSVLSLFLSIITYLLAGFLAVNIFSRPQLKTLIEIASLTILGGCLLETSQSIITGFEKFQYRSFLLIFQAIIQTIFAPLLIYLGYGVFGVVLGVTLASIMTGIIGLAIIYFKFYETNDSKSDVESDNSIGKTLKAMLKYGYPLGLSAILLGFLPQFYNFLLAIFCSDIAYGNYQIAAKFIVLISFLAIPITITLFPAFSKIDPKTSFNNLKTVFRSSAKYSALLTFPVIAAIAVLSEPVVTLFFGQNYASAALFLSLAVLPHIWIGFGMNSYETLLMGQGLTRNSLMLNLISLAFGIPLSLILIPHFGVIGLIITTLIAGIPSLIAGLFWAHKYCKCSIDWTFSIRSGLASAFAAAIAYVALMLLNSSSLIELIVGGLIFAISYLLLVPTLRVMNLDDVKSLRQMFTGLGIVTYISDILLNIIERILKFKLVSQ